MDLDALKAKHGQVWVASKGDATFVIKRPSSADYRRFIMDMAEDRKNLFDANERLIKASVVHPPAEDLDRILDELPGLVIELGSEVASIASGQGKLEAKKA